MFLLLPILIGCNQDVSNTRKQNPPGENFAYDHSVRITSPTNGEQVSESFTLSYTHGADVASIGLSVDNQPVSTLTDLGESTGEIVVTVDGGSHTITLNGYSDAGDPISDYSITVIAVTDDPWVSFVSPTSGDTISNPVTFMLDASGDIEEIELFADGWSLGIAEPGELFSYEFSGVGYERTIEAHGFMNDESIATDSITLTVDAGTEPTVSEFTELMVEILESYPTDGSHEYYWPEDGSWYGTTRDIWYLDTLVAEGDPQNRSYCVGITWEVFMRAFEEADAMTGGDGSLNNMSVADLSEFRVDWFIRDLWGDGNVDALYNYGLGEEVTDFADAQIGDSVQFWRNSGSGHNVLFIDWVYDSDGDITGLEYWSTQGSTDGIGYNIESFGTSGSTINPAYTFIARPAMPWDWIPW